MGHYLFPSVFPCSNVLVILHRRLPYAWKTTHGFDQLLIHFFLILNIASIKLTCTRGLGHVGESHYLIGLAVSAALCRTASLELGPILAALYGAIRARLSVHKSSQAPRHVAPRSSATYCETSFILQYNLHDSVLSSDARLHVNLIHILACHAVC